MSKLAYKLIIAITLCTLTVALIVGSYSLYKSGDFIKYEVKSKLQMGAEKYANELSAIFNRTMGVVDALAANVEVSFDKDKFQSDPKYFNEFKNELGHVLRQTILESSVAQGLYFTFDPELTNSNQEVWYARENNEIVLIEAKFDENKRDFNLPAKPDMQYFFKPIMERKGVWTGPYLDKDIEKNIVSYSRAVYSNGLLLGVVGADVLSEDTTGIVSDMNIYDSGYAFLLDEKFTFISHPDRARGSHLLEEKEEGELKLISKAIKNNKSGVIQYKYREEEKILGYSHMNNGWIIGITQPVSVAFQPVTSLTLVMIVVAIITILATLIFAWIFSNSFSKPIIAEKDQLIKSNREKDIMLTFKSRQAKVGEMIANIAHQWKQPLNSINLILVNILDAYRYQELTEEKLEKSVKKADKIVKNLVETVSDFTNFLKPATNQTAFGVCDNIKTALNLMEESLSHNNIKIEFENNSEFFSYGYPNEFAHVIFNILNNARDAILNYKPKNSLIKINVFKENNLIVIEIYNPCSPITEEIIEKAFDPYFTTKDETEGTGLGLYICKVIVEQRMGGAILLSNKEDGVCCTVKVKSHTGSY